MEEKMKIFKGVKKHVVTLILLSGMVSYLNLQIALYISYAIDGIIFHTIETVPEYFKQLLEIDTIKALFIISITIIIFNLIIVLANYIRERITIQFTLKVGTNLKKKLYEHILKLTYESYHCYSKAEMLQRVNDDAQEYSNFFKVQFNLILDIISMGLFIVSKSIFLSTSITICLIITISIMLGFTLWYHQKMPQILEKVISKKKKMLETTINNINQFKFVRIYNRRKEELQKYKRLNKEYTKEQLKFIKLVLFYDIVSEHIIYLSTPIICLLGGISIIHGNMTLGGLAALIIFATEILGCLYSFGENLEVVDTFFVVKKKIKKVMNLKEEDEKNYSYDLNGDIVFHNVSINISKRKILANLNFEVKKGEKVAITGENGSGKSILAKAILGFYPVKGNIYFNYHNSKQIDKANIRRYIDYISGDTDLFTGTIEDNIKLGTNKKKEELTKVIKESEIYKDMSQMKDGYQTMIGEKGVKLSGGQKQRILIARALLRNKPIMIFDNTFSKLDNKTTDNIFQNLRKKYPKTTMIFITHKLEIEKYADRIIKIEEGTSKV